MKGWLLWLVVLIATLAVAVLLVVPASAASAPTLYGVTFVRSDIYNITMYANVTEDGALVWSGTIPAFGQATADLSNGSYVMTASFGGRLGACGGIAFDVNGSAERFPVLCDQTQPGCAGCPSPTLIDPIPLGAFVLVPAVFIGLFVFGLAEWDRSERRRGR